MIICSEIVMKRGISDIPDKIDKYGTIFWHRDGNGKLHKLNRPAVIYPNGTEFWYRDGDGERHRDNDLPAVILADDTEIWYQNEKLHREDEPAVIHSDGIEEWYQDGEEIKKPGNSGNWYDNFQWNN